MFATRTILLLRAFPRPASLMFKWLSFGRHYHTTRTVMEAKQYLLRCVHAMKPERPALPSLIMVDDGARNADIKIELERWLERHTRLRRVPVVCSPAKSWIKRIWNQNP
jgi:hypothetical protein